MEPGLADEEEVDPRIQVGGAGGARGPWPPRSARLGAPGACAQGSGPGRPGAAGERLRAPGFARFLGRLRCPRGRGPTPSPGLPVGPGRLPAACPALGADVQQRGKGAGAPRRVRGYPIRLCAPRALRNLRTPGARPAAQRAPPGWWAPATHLHLGRPPCPGVGALTWQRGPSGATPRPRADSLLANRRVYCHPRRNPPAGLKRFKTQLFLLVRSSVNRNQGQLVRKADAREGERVGLLPAPPFLREMIKKQFPSRDLSDSLTSSPSKQKSTAHPFVRPIFLLFRKSLVTNPAFQHELRFLET